MALYETRPELMKQAASDGGLELTPKSIFAIRRYFHVAVRRLLDTGSIEYLSSPILERRIGSVPSSTLNFGLYGADKKQLATLWFQDQPHPILEKKLDLTRLP